jgi:hypothetical protein
VFSACASRGGSAQAATESATKAVYDDNASAVTQNFDDSLKSQVTRSEIGLMSDQMHRLGDYKGLRFVSSDAARDEYTYRATFSKGSLPIVVRLDADGRFAAYRMLVPAR